MFGRKSTDPKPAPPPYEPLDFSDCTAIDLAFSLARISTWVGREHSEWILEAARRLLATPPAKSDANSPSEASAGKDALDELENPDAGKVRR